MMTMICFPPAPVLLEGKDETNRRKCWNEPITTTVHHHPFSNLAKSSVQIPPPAEDFVSALCSSPNSGKCVHSCIPEKLASLPLMALYHPKPYKFRTSSPIKICKESATYVKVPPFWLLFDHTIAVLCILLSRMDRPLSSAQLHWTFTCLRRIKHPDGEHPSVIASCMDFIEDCLLDQCRGVTPNSVPGWPPGDSFMAPFRTFPATVDDAIPTTLRTTVRSDTSCAWKPSEYKRDEIASRPRTSCATAPRESLRWGEPKVSETFLESSPQEKRAPKTPAVASQRPQSLKHRLDSRPLPQREAKCNQSPLKAAELHESERSSQSLSSATDTLSKTSSQLSCENVEENSEPRSRKPAFFLTRGMAISNINSKTSTRIIAAIFTPPGSGPQTGLTIAEIDNCQISMQPKATTGGPDSNLNLDETFSAQHSPSIAVHAVSSSSSLSHPFSLSRISENNEPYDSSADENLRTCIGPTIPNSDEHMVTTDSLGEPEAPHDRDIRNEEETSVMLPPLSILPPILNKLHNCPGRNASLNELYSSDTQNEESENVYRGTEYEAQVSLKVTQLLTEMLARNVQVEKAYEEEHIEDSYPLPCIDSRRPDSNSMENVVNTENAIPNSMFSTDTAGSENKISMNDCRIKLFDSHVADISDPSEEYTRFLKKEPNQTSVIGSEAASGETNSILVSSKLETGVLSENECYSYLENFQVEEITEVAQNKVTNREPLMSADDLITQETGSTHIKTMSEQNSPNCSDIAENREISSDVKAETRKAIILSNITTPPKHVSYRSPMMPVNSERGVTNAKVLDPSDPRITKSEGIEFLKIGKIIQPVLSSRNLNSNETAPCIIRKTKCGKHILATYKSSSNEIVPAIGKKHLPADIEVKKVKIIKERKSAKTQPRKEGVKNKPNVLGKADIEKKKVTMIKERKSANTQLREEDEKDKRDELDIADIEVKKVKIIKKRKYANTQPEEESKRKKLDELGKGDIAEEKVTIIKERISANTQPREEGEMDKPVELGKADNERKKVKMIEESKSANTQSREEGEKDKTNVLGKADIEREKVKILKERKFANTQPRGCGELNELGKEDIEEEKVKIIKEIKSANAQQGKEAERDKPDELGKENSSKFMSEKNTDKNTPTTSRTVSFVKIRTSTPNSEKGNESKIAVETPKAKTSPSKIAKGIEKKKRPLNIKQVTAQKVSAVPGASNMMQEKGPTLSKPPQAKKQSTVSATTINGKQASLSTRLNKQAASSSNASTSVRVSNQTSNNTFSISTSNNNRIGIPNNYIKAGRQNQSILDRDKNIGFGTKLPVRKPSKEKQACMEQSKTQKLRTFEEDKKPPNVSENANGEKHLSKVGVVLSKEFHGHRQKSNDESADQGASDIILSNISPIVSKDNLAQNEKGTERKTVDTNINETKKSNIPRMQKPTRLSSTSSSRGQKETNTQSSLPKINDPNQSSQDIISRRVKSAIVTGRNFETKNRSMSAGRTSNQFTNTSKKNENNVTANTSSVLDNKNRISSRDNMLVTTKGSAKSKETGRNDPSKTKFATSNDEARKKITPAGKKYQLASNIPRDRESIVDTKKFSPSATLVKPTTPKSKIYMTQKSSPTTGSPKPPIKSTKLPLPKQGNFIHKHVVKNQTSKQDTAQSDSDKALPQKEEKDVQSKVNVKEAGKTHSIKLTKDVETVDKIDIMPKHETEAETSLEKTMLLKHKDIRNSTMSVQGSNTQGPKEKLLVTDEGKADSIVLKTLSVVHEKNEPKSELLSEKEDNVKNI